MPTTRQYRRLFALAKRAGCDSDALHAIVLDAHNRESLRDLTDREYESLTVLLSDRAAALSRPVSPLPNGRGARGEGSASLSSHPRLLRFLETEGLPWQSVVITDTDLAYAAYILDDFRRYRGPSGRLSEGQVRRILAGWSRYRLSTWRQAAEAWLTHYRRYNEAYFLGVLRNTARDARRTSGGRTHRSAPTTLASPSP